MSLQMKMSMCKSEDDLFIYIRHDSGDDYCATYCRLYFSRPDSEEINNEIDQFIKSVKYQLFQYFGHESNANDYIDVRQALYDFIFEARSDYYQKIAIETTNKYKQELIAKSWHPSRLDWVLDNKEKDDVQTSFN